ncbi:MAG: YlbF family regulator, partial [Phycisphaerae bacterium]|nr:YlbF family regulator [Phycisphaerae bacterium]
MTDIIELAQRLGKAISESTQAANLRTAREKMSKQGEITQLLKDYQAQAEKVAKLEQENKPVEVDDKHNLQELHGKLVASDVFKKF